MRINLKAGYCEQYKSPNKDGHIEKCQCYRKNKRYYTWIRTEARLNRHHQQEQFNKVKGGNKFSSLLKPILTNA